MIRSMRPIKLVGLALMAVFALSAFVATAAQAQIETGPLWTTTSGVLPKNTVSVSLTSFSLTSPASTVTCKKLTDTGTIKAEGLDTATVLFEECEAVGPGLTKCLATGVKDTTIGHITVPNLTTKLMYPDNTALGPGALDAFFPAPEAKENIFAEFKLKADTGGTCGLLEGKTVIVKATGSLVTKPENINKKCGVLAEVGKDDGGTPPVFLSTVSGAPLFALGALFFPAPKILNALLATEKNKFELVKCSLQTGSEEAVQSGFSMVNTSPEEAYGWIIN
jgi:hypothetical protein